MTFMAVGDSAFVKHEPQDKFYAARKYFLSADLTDSADFLNWLATWKYFLSADLTDSADFF